MEKEHFEVLLERMESNFKLVVEGLEGQRERAERDKAELQNEARSNFEFIAEVLTGVNQRLDKLETKVDEIETKVDELDGKVDRLAKGQREIKKQLTSVMEIQSDQGTRLERVELSLVDHVEGHP